MSEGRVIIIGSGAAGLMAAFSAASSGADTLVIEKNEKAGKKLYITGKGRCNFTNLRPVPDFLEHVISNPRFLYSALSGFTPEDAMSFFEESGCPVKVERGQRAFPVSDHASDITKALLKRAQGAGARFEYCTRVKDIITKDGRATGVVTDGGEIGADAVVVATGGESYRSTGSTGDGYAWAAGLGHRITKTAPSLVPFNIEGDICLRLQGLTLKNAELSLLSGDKALFRERGELLFTHFGISGPLALSASAIYHSEIKGARFLLDLKPALSEKQLDERLIRDFDAYRSRAFKNALSDLFPARLIPVMAELSGIDPGKRAAEISRAERQGFARLIKGVELKIAGVRGFDEAVVTRGGVDVREVSPKTMESRLIKGLYFAGEILDVDALTGGYNLQIAWSTGYMAGENAAKG